MTPTIRAFRFEAGANRYALDIQSGRALLFIERPEGWQSVPDFPEVSASAGAIEAAGGPVKFVSLLLVAVNAVLRILQGKPRPADLPDAKTPQDEVLAYLSTSVIAHTLMDGTVQLRVR